MELRTENQKLRTLYLKFLRNQLSAAEIRRLLPQLAAQSDAELRTIVAEFMLGEEPPVLGEEESLANILSVIHDEHIHIAPKPAIFRKLYKKMSVAAAILLISGLGIYLYSHNRSVNLVIEIAAGSSDLKPGTDRAILKLSDGSQIDLGPIGKKREIRQDGVTISVGEDGQIVYQALEGVDSKSSLGYNTISTPRGGKFKILLPDGTQIWLNASSSLTYPTSFMQAGSRKVKLQGEAYFEVAKQSYEGKAMPFIVSTDQQEVKVLGTHFNVNAYEDEGATKTTLLEGSVLLDGKTMLRPGEQGISDDGQIKVKLVNASDFIDWKTGDFNLKGNDFRSMMRKISRWYDVEIIYEDSAPENVRLGGWISREKNISSILNLIQRTGDVHFKLEGRRVIVSK
ncbi:FecR family protein [Pedobacter sp. Leaf250]|uniref:FecR family protein n=1 Tax=Pedobacter sp. Leaf250 TaxID=2876559 RepID=UPI001E49C16F|nr:FecR family protein [Pedobacter sp. Leaf250]